MTPRSDAMSSGSGGGIGVDRDRLVSAVRRQWWIVIQAIVVIALVAVFMELRKPTTYTAEARVLAEQSADITSTELSNLTGQSFTTQDTATFLATQVHVVRSPAVVEDAASQLDETAAEVSGSMWVGVDGGTSLLVISATADSAQAAIDIANAVASAYLSNRDAAATAKLQTTADEMGAQIQSIDSQIDALTAVAVADPLAAARLAALQNQSSQLFTEQQRLLVTKGLVSVGEVVAPATSAWSVGPRPVRVAVVGAALGLVLGLGLALLRELLDDRLRTARDVEQGLGLPVLTSLPEDREIGEGAELPTFERPGSPFGESVRSLRTSIDFLGIDEPIRSLVVTSPDPGDGKSLLAANLAVAYAQAGYKTLLISADLRRPHLEGTVGVAPQRLGLTDVVASRPRPSASANGSDEANGGVSILQVILPTKVPNLDLFPSGTTAQNAGELLASRRATAVFAATALYYEIVIYDTPPTMFADAAALSLHADGVLLVARAGRTRRSHLTRAVRAFSDGAAPVLGVVMNRVPQRRRDSYDYAYSYDAPVPAPSATPDGAGEEAGENEKALSRRQRRKAARRAGAEEASEQLMAGAESSEPATSP